MGGRVSRKPGGGLETAIKPERGGPGVQKEKAKTKKSGARDRKKEYRKPEVKRLGTVRGVTAGGGTGEFLEEPACCI